MVPLTQITTHQMYPMSLNLSQRHTRKKNNTTNNGKVISAGELVVKAEYLFSVQENTNWYGKQQPLQQTIIFQTRTIIHTCLGVIILRYVQDIPNNLCISNQAEK